VDEGCSVVLVRDLVRREKRCRNCTTQEMVAEARAKNVKLIVGLVAILALLLLIARWLSGAG
jgi:hypothetical protein